jgi:tripartite-type tricarboxylate transporter receptor subunit TctC
MSAIACSATMTGRNISLLLAAAALAFSAIASAQAQTFPAKPVTIVVPFAAGGPTDSMARAISERMRQALGQAVIIENVTGAGGTIGVTRAERAAPDGYTISMGHLGTHVINGAIYPLPFDLINDFEPVILLGANPMLIVSKNSIPAKDLKELIAWLRANQEKATIGTAGVGSGAHFSAVYLQSLIGTKIGYVPYRGTGPALQDLVAGQIDLIVDQASNALPQAQSGKIRAYGVTDTKRLAAAPGIPTVDEAGLPGYHISLWSALWVPKGTPKDVIAKLNDAAMQALADPAVKKRFGDVGVDIPPREQQTPDALRALQKSEAAKWWPIIKAANVKPE